MFICEVSAYPILARNAPAAKSQKVIMRKIKKAGYAQFL
jgi:hypothetical protein